MGKRNKEVNVGRRRPMIQLGSSQKQGFSAVSRTIISNEETNAPKKNEMDDQLAGFLAEINSLETPSTETEIASTASVEATTSKATETKQSLPDNLLYDPENFDPSTQGHLLPEPWHACYDDKTMCYYYWNTITNEVQWYPPVATIPPPPPPPTKDIVANEGNDEDEIKEKIEKVEVKVDITVEPLTEKEGGDVKENASKGLNHDKNADKKEKDKELMNQIKERIQKKKEKVRKEKEERQKLEDEALEKLKLEKEENLREKLIKKKLEREKNVENEENKETKGDESFSIDMFSTGDVKPRDRKSSESKTKDISDDDNRSKSWRIIDAGYDDDDDDEDNDGDGDGDGDGEKSGKKNKEEQNDAKQNKSNEIVDDYAEMLLEDAITSDDKPPTPSHPPPPIPAPLPPATPPPPPDTDDKPPPPPEEDEPPTESIKPLITEDTVADKDNIDEASKELFDKLDFLGISTKDLRGLVVCYIELETRIKDWQAGALDSSYLLEKIHELSEKIAKHEEKAAPEGWVCNWSSEFKMYYYYETSTGKSQWEYPIISQTAQSQQPQVSVVSSVAMPTLPTIPTFPTSHVLALQTQQMMMTAVNPAYPGLMMSAALTPPLVAPALVPTAQPFVTSSATTTTTPLDSKKRPATDSDSGGDPYRDPYRGTAKKKKEISTFPDQLAEKELISEPRSPASSKSIIAAAPLMKSRESSPALISSSNVDSDGTFSPIPSKNNTAAETVLNAKAKLKKKRKVDSSGLPSKKKKHVSTLVAKWQTVKQQVDEEENVEEESEEEDFEAQSEKRISEWKKEIEMSGEKDFNPNFQEIKGNWRNRLKKKTT